jgi:hypothetical protein
MEGQKKFITDENVRLALTIITLLVPVFSCYLAIKLDVNSIQKDVQAIKSNVDRICEKDDGQDTIIGNIIRDVAALEALNK